MDDTLILEKDGPIARLVLNRPDKHNALRFDDLDRLVEALREAEEDDDVKVVVLKGNGPSFCAGHDYNDALKSYGLDPAPDGSKRRRPGARPGWQQTPAGGASVRGCCATASSA